MNTQLGVRKAYSVSIDSYGYEVMNLFNSLNEPYVFVKNEKGQCVGYFSKQDLFSYMDNKEWNNSKVANMPFHKHISIIQDEEDISNLFTYFSEEVVIISGNKQEETYVVREDILFYFLTNHSTSPDWTRSLLNSIGSGIIIVNEKGKIINFNPIALEMIHLSHESIQKKSIGEIFGDESFQKIVSNGESVLNKVIVTDKASIVVDFGPIRDRKGVVTGAIIVVQNLPDVENMATEFENVKTLNKDLQAILSSIYDEILVVDKNGVLLRYSGDLIKDFWKTDKKQLIGVNLTERDYEGVFFSEIVKMVIKQKKKISVTQDTHSGKNVLVVGNPVFDQQGKLERIIIALRDITETVMLREELQHVKEMSRKYKEELDSLRDLTNKRNFQQVIYCSKKIGNVMDFINKVASVSSTVLLIGESGVGKEVFASKIHELGTRSEGPFIKINCGAIPENLLESELFGYVKGAFTGANTEGKKGLFELANKGIIFLDEVSELTLHLQVKLLRVLQEREITPVGGTKSINVDVQIISATNKNLEDLVEEGKFREDLYYRLNVIPIHIPPLRERTEDIPLLSLYFLQVHNQNYGKNKQFTQDALDILESHTWPGNVRQLQNIIERIVVVTDEDLITSNHIKPILKRKPRKNKAIIEDYDKIIPLKEATRQLEEKLILFAMDRYKTTVRAAKVLEVSQATISRKYQEIIERKLQEKDS